MKKWIIWVSVLLLAGLAQAADVLFTGSNTVNNLMSDTNNWQGLALPVTGDNILIAANGTSVSNPAVLDSTFNVDLAQARIFSGGIGGTGMAYAEVVDGGIFRATSIVVGNSNNQWYDGTLTLRTGAATEARYINSGGFEIAGTTELSGNRAQGFVTVEPGVSFSLARLILKQYGTLTYEFGANSVSTFIPTQTTAGGANTLDGLVKVDLGALVNEGSYALIDGSSANALIAGAMKTWLDGEGGSFSGTGDFSNATFQVVSGGTIGWTLSLEDGDQDLILTVAGGGLEEEDLTLFADTFDRADSADVNLNSATNQSGALAPLTYAVYTNATPNVSAISSNEVLLGVDGSGNIRLAPQVNLSDSAAAIVDAGGFEISYTVDAGIDYPGTVHGSYSTALILSQASMVAGASSGAANTWQGLYITIAGNGQVRINSQGISLFNLQRSEYGDAFQVGDPNDVRLAVETDGFLNTSSNTFTLYINEVEVASTNFFWKASNDLGLALEAISYSALFDNLEISRMAPPQFTANGVPYAWLDEYYDGLVSDADYENAANTDTDGDGLTGLEEYLTGTDPTDPASVFALRASGMTAEGMVVSWPSVEGALYDLSSKSNLMVTGWTPVATGLTGLAVETSYTTTVSGVSGFFSIEMQ